jgi:multidrug efflux pump subunit AcrB
MNISPVGWLLSASLWLCSSLFVANGASSTNTQTGPIAHSSKSVESGTSQATQEVEVRADHRKAIEAHLRRSDQQIRRLLRSASMSNIDEVLESIDVIRQGDEACIQQMDRCRNLDASPSTAEVLRPSPPFDSDPET